jgi:hypothetical protein
MSTSPAERRQIEIRGGYGETEVIWGEPVGPGVYQIPNSPIHAYDISAGTVVRVAPTDGRRTASLCRGARAFPWSHRSNHDGEGGTGK